MKQLKLFEANAIHIDPKDVKVFVHRERDQDVFENMKASIKEEGQQEPIEVIDMKHRSEKERERRGGGLYRWGLVAGEGRLTACKQLKIKVWAIVKEMNDAERVGRFLSENLNRDALPWHDKAKLVKAELDKGAKVEDVAKRFFISTGHVYKFQRIVNHVSHELESDVAAMSMNEAEEFAAQAPEVQRIVLQVAKKENMQDQLKTIIAKAKSLARQHGPEKLTERDLKASLSRVNEDLDRLRPQLKLTRLHWSLGPQNLVALLEDSKMRKELEKHEIPFAKFEKLTQK